MSTTPAARGGTAETAPRRQSCDRCHGQKLRCTRPGNSVSGACNRCLRQGAQCVYSPSLPKGRPSMYRLAKTSISTSTTASNNATVEEDASANSNGSSNGTDYTWPPPLTWTDMLDGSEPNSTQHDSGAAFLDAFPNLPNWGNPSNSEGDRQHDNSAREAHLHLQTLSHGIGFGSDLFDSNSSMASTSSNINIPNADKTGPDVGIALLSQLSTRLYPLHRSSCSLAEAAVASKDGNHGRVSPLIDDAALKSVTSWLVHVSANMNLSFHIDRQYPPMDSTTTGDTLQGAFCGAHQLLEILQCLQGKAVPGTTTGSSTPSSSSSGGMDTGFQVPDIPNFLNSNDISPSPSSQSSNTVVRHLVIACHTLLLNIYVGVLLALQHDADLRAASSILIIGNPNADSATLADIRVVLVVQLCSYLIGRLHRAVGLYSSPATPSSLPQHPQHEYFAPNQSSLPSRCPITDAKGISDLEMEVQQRLARLRQTLRI